MPSSDARPQHGDRDAAAHQDTAEASALARVDEPRSLSPDARPERERAAATLAMRLRTLGHMPPFPPPTTYALPSAPPTHQPS